MEETNTFLGHFHELRQRLIYSMISVVVMFIALWIFRDDLIYLLTYPLQKVLHGESHQVIMLSVMDKIFIHLKTVFIVSIIFSIPFILLQVWKFIMPALYVNEKKVTAFFFLGSTGLFVTGIAICYFLILPFAFSFLINYSETYEGYLLQDTPKMPLQIYLKEHLRLTLNLLFVFGLVFELPLIMVFITRLGVLSVDTLKRYRKHALIMGLIFSAILTPPDPLTMVGMAFPMVLLYELGLILSRLLAKSQPDENLG